MESMDIKPMFEPIIEFKNVTKVYKIKLNRGKIKNALFPAFEDFLAVKDINFKINRNETFAILGPNRAGKTTIIKMICGLLTPSSGTIIIDNKNMAKEYYKIQNLLGVMLGNHLIYNRISAYANLKFYCKLYKIPNYKERVDELLRFVDLYDWRNQLVENYSLGMKTKLALARALVHDPKILILDEPTLGLDINNSIFIRKILKNMSKTIIITTHNMEVANDVSDRIALLNKGKIVKIDSVKNLKAEYLSKIFIEIESPEIADLINLLNKVEFIDKIEKIQEFKIKIEFENKDNIHKLLNLISEKKIWNIRNIAPSLEDIFLKFTTIN